MLLAALTWKACSYAALAMIALPSAQLAHSSRAAAKLLLPRDGTPVRPNPGSAANRPIHCTFEMTVSEPTTTCINDIRNEGTWQCPVDGCNNGGENLSPHDYPFSEFSFKRCKRAHGGGPKDAITVFPTRFSETRSEKLLLVFGHELPPHSYTPRKEEMKIPVLLDLAWRSERFKALVHRVHISWMNETGSKYS
ncbi:hypothetical protein PSHT_01500 [Puccinia striiformis]|uniref:Secreted protein n=1 Tax=Puccinia striiformis TaxID=27350 RepID=A0A2S4WKE0_9BASI|nr:hypothetical protein PSHT_01500 [Puccinia striiformis]